MRAALPLLLLLAACGEDQPEAPAMSVAPQPITYYDIEENNLYGASCAYASGKSMAPLVIAMADEAVMKVDGQIVRFALDPQCKEVKLGTGSRYLGEDRILDLAVTGGGVQSGAESARFEGTVKLSDGSGKVLYATQGTAQCGS